MLVAVMDLLVSELQGPLDQAVVQVVEGENIEAVQNFEWALQQ